MVVVFRSVAGRVGGVCGCSRMRLRDPFGIRLMIY